MKKKKRTGLGEEHGKEKEENGESERMRGRTESEVTRKEGKNLGGPARATRRLVPVEYLTHLGQNSPGTWVALRTYCITT